jgi:hypothetical protein
VPINSKHPAYLQREEDWMDCRAAFEGQRAVKAAGVRFLPKLSGQSTSDYDAYKARALFYSITSKTVSALVGMALDKAPELKYPDTMKGYFEDHNGVQFHESLSSVVQELILVGRFGCLLDRPVGGGQAYPAFYATEDILNWHYSESTSQLDLLVLREYYVERDTADEYVSQYKKRYRKLELLEDGTVQVSVWKCSKDKDEDFIQVGQNATITNLGQSIKYIPFICANAFGLGIDPVKPPMLDIVDINLSHYRTSADLEHGRHFTGLPTPWITGADADGAMHIGSTKAWVIPDHQARVGFLEFTGQGLASLEKALTEKHSQLATMSARLIDNSTRGSEAAETVKLRYLSETASLKTIVRAAEAFMNAYLNVIGDMDGHGQKSVSVALNMDFLAVKMTAAELTAWVQAYLDGGVTKEMLLHAYKQGGALPPPGADAGEIPDRTDLIEEQKKVATAGKPTTPSNKP